MSNLPSKIKVACNMLPEIADYYSGYNLSTVCDYLLARYDITLLPQTSMRRGGRRIERSVTITNEDYILMRSYTHLRNNELSLSRLLEFGYNLDVLSDSDFVTYYNSEHKKSPVVRQYDDGNDTTRVQMNKIHNHMMKAADEILFAVSIAEKIEYKIPDIDELCALMSSILQSVTDGGKV